MISIECHIWFCHYDLPAFILLAIMLAIILIHNYKFKKNVMNVKRPLRKKIDIHSPIILVLYVSM